MSASSRRRPRSRHRQRHPSQARRSRSRSPSRSRSHSRPCPPAFRRQWWQAPLRRGRLHLRKRRRGRLRRHCCGARRQREPRSCPRRRPKRNPRSRRRHRRRSRRGCGPSRVSPASFPHASLAACQAVAWRTTGHACSEHHLSCACLPALPAGAVEYEPCREGSSRDCRRVCREVFKGRSWVQVCAFQRPAA